ncbi:hypothetical protein [Denitromonas ohlonensis]|uniref:Uncharacterized protein n=2 Tax=Denitromonas TaxID=139331 RepID=A0A557SL52_9RHOO|nr:hypothetical protein [Denitromonas ohlonensis]TVO67962.1 hypothetical protein FHP90_05110 [Denitromonas ohlonensis]TVO78133.1 hypothetical protein FHP89_06550 [Denitromonas ohlonensis]TVT47204.1 MAG: hypothetical protein FHP94_14000 [Denitromonas halophila]TVT66785.1 MAG: hypothetical protein FHP93_18350 [Denitromonas halophila]
MKSDLEAEQLDTTSERILLPAVAMRVRIKQETRFGPTELDVTTSLPVALAIVMCLGFVGVLAIATVWTT